MRGQQGVLRGQPLVLGAIGPSSVATRRDLDEAAALVAGLATAAAASAPLCLSTAAAELGRLCSLLGLANVPQASTWDFSERALGPAAATLRQATPCIAAAAAACRDSRALPPKRARELAAACAAALNAAQCIETLLLSLFVATRDATLRPRLEPLVLRPDLLPAVASAAAEAAQLLRAAASHAPPRAAAADASCLALALPLASALLGAAMAVLRTWPEAQRHLSGSTAKTAVRRAMLPLSGLSAAVLECVQPPAEAGAPTAATAAVAAEAPAGPAEDATAQLGGVTWRSLRGAHVLRPREAGSDEQPAAWYAVAAFVRALLVADVLTVVINNEGSQHDDGASLTAPVKALLVVPQVQRMVLTTLLLDACRLHEQASSSDQRSGGSQRGSTRRAAARSARPQLPQELRQLQAALGLGAWDLLHAITRAPIHLYSVPKVSFNACHFALFHSLQHAHAAGMSAAAMPASSSSSGDGGDGANNSTSRCSGAPSTRGDASSCSSDRGSTGASSSGAASASGIRGGSASSGTPNAAVCAALLPAVSWMIEQLLQPVGDLPAPPPGPELEEAALKACPGLHLLLDAFLAQRWAAGSIPSWQGLGGDLATNCALTMTGTNALSCCGTSIPAVAPAPDSLSSGGDGAAGGAWLARLLLRLTPAVAPVLRQRQQQHLRTALVLQLQGPLASMLLFSLAAEPADALVPLLVQDPRTSLAALELAVRGHMYTQLVNDLHDGCVWPAPLCLTEELIRRLLRLLASATGRSSARDSAAAATSSASTGTSGGRGGDSGSSSGSGDAAAGRSGAALDSACPGELAAALIASADTQRRLHSLLVSCVKVVACGLSAKGLVRAVLPLVPGHAVASAFLQFSSVDVFCAPQEVLHVMCDVAATASSFAVAAAATASAVATAGQRPGAVAGTATAGMAASSRSRAFEALPSLFSRWGIVVARVLAFVGAALQPAILGAGAASSVGAGASESCSASAAASCSASDANASSSAWPWQAGDWLHLFSGLSRVHDECLVFLQQLLPHLASQLPGSEAAAAATLDALQAHLHAATGALLALLRELLQALPSALGDAASTSSQRQQVCIAPPAEGAAAQALLSRSASGSGSDIGGGGSGGDGSGSGDSCAGGGAGGGNGDMAALADALGAAGLALLALGNAMCGALPLPTCCNSPRCCNLLYQSEEELVSVKSQCSACQVARWCGRKCSEEFWPSHKAACRLLRGSAPAKGKAAGKGARKG